MSAQDDIYDYSVRHVIGVRRYSSTEVARLIALLNKSQLELEDKLATRNARDILNSGSFTSQRYKALATDIAEMRKSVFQEILQSNRKEMMNLAAAEQEFGKQLMQKAVPVQFDYASATKEVLMELVSNLPFAGGANQAKTLGQWWQDLSTVDHKRINDAIKLGMTQGEGIDQIAKRVAFGTDMTKRNAEAIARTGVNHVSTQSRNAFFNANKDVVSYTRWTSVLDGRTTEICQARDGKYSPIGNTPIEEVPEPHLDPLWADPPAHMNCRSVKVAVLDTDGVVDKMGDRPFVRDTRTGRLRERDFRAEAKEEAGSKWGSMTTSERNTAVRVRKQNWAKENIGQVPGKTTYDEWLRKQPTSFQNEVLGPERAKAFRNGAKVDQFVDASGHKLTLNELRDRYPNVMAGEASTATSPVKPVSVPKVPVDYGTRKPDGDFLIPSKADLDVVTKAHEVFYDNWKVKTPGITALEQQVVADYQGVGFGNVNRRLRAGDLDAVSEEVRHIDSVFERSTPLEQDLFTYRAARFQEVTATQMFGGKLPVVGTVFGDEAYLSTSMGTHVLDKYRKYSKVQGTSASLYEFRVRVKEGTKIVVMPKYGTEAEVLLHRNSKFRVLESRLAGPNRYVVEVETVDG